MECYFCIVRSVHCIVKSFVVIWQYTLLYTSFQNFLHEVYFCIIFVVEVGLWIFNPQNFLHTWKFRKFKMCSQFPRLMVFLIHARACQRTFPLRPLLQYHSTAKFMHTKYLFNTKVECKCEKIAPQNSQGCILIWIRMIPSIMITDSLSTLLIIAGMCLQYFWYQYLCTLDIDSSDNKSTWTVSVQINIYDVCSLVHLQLK